MSQVLQTPSPGIMSSLAASPRISKPLDSGGHHHSQVRQLHSGPIPTQHFDFSSSVLQAATVAALTPSGALASSAGYFGFMAEPGDAAYGSHSTKNWSPASSSIRSTAARSPLPIHLDNPPQMFQKQTEVLAQKLQRAATTGSLVKAREKAVSRQSLSDNDYFSSVRAAVPAGLDNPDSEPWPPVSAPVSLQASPGLLSPTNLKLPNRSMTLPNPPKDNQPALITPNKLSELITRFSTNGLLLLDVRTYKSFSEARINTAVNLCIPTTLLKRPSFNVAKLSETFANNPDKERFGKWKQMKYIVVYDADSRDATETSALAALHTLNKFSREGWGGSSFILKGGFSAFSAAFPKDVDRNPLPNTSNAAKGGMSLRGAGGPERVVGGVFNCPLPAHQPAVNPFFSNIRQNMDLIDGVGEMPVHLPTTMGSENIAHLPAWLSEVTCKKDSSKLVADRFLNIEKAEQRRMQEALNVSVIYDSPTSTDTKPHSLAGVEKGSKNRYNNIWPYDHSRVKLQEYPNEECDYVNASHISVPRSHKRYIASQAPLPSTFRDFWSMIWEQDVRVIVNLTAEEEGGRLKSHKYWETDEYGPLKLTRIQERKVSLEPTSLKTSPKRRSVAPSSSPQHQTPSSSGAESVPYIIVRKFTLEHVEKPFIPMREITQLQYSAWPDLGTPAHPSHVLGLVEHTNAVVRATTSSSERTANKRPVLVHCSAGCGRTGTFCTIDSVINMMKRQQVVDRRRRQSPTDGSDLMTQLGIEDEGDWITRDDEDLVFKAVSEFRDQRISMVQCLQQYVLCYETVLEWLAKQSPVDSGKRKA